MVVMVDCDNSSTKYIQGAGQEIQIIGNKAMLRAPILLAVMSCSLFLFVFWFVRLFVFFIPDENSFRQQAMTDAHTGGCTIWSERGEWAARSALLGGIVQGCQDQVGWELEHVEGGN